MPEVDYTAPRDAPEERLATIWACVLGVPRVGIHDDFFDLGGNSLLAAQACSAMTAVVKQVLPPAVLLEAPTIADLVTLLAQTDGSPLMPALVPLQPRGTRPPLFCIPLYRRTRAGLSGSGPPARAAPTSLCAARDRRPRCPGPALRRDARRWAMWRPFVRCNRRVPTIWQAVHREGWWPMRWPASWRRRGPRWTCWCSVIASVRAADACPPCAIAWERTQMPLRMLTARLRLHGTVWSTLPVGKRAAYLHQRMATLRRLLDHQVPSKEVIHLILDPVRLHCSAEVAVYVSYRPWRFRFHWLPVHASWLSFIEAWFALVSKKCIARSAWATFAAAATGISDFIATYNAHQAHPFTWRKGVRFSQRLKDKLAQKDTDAATALPRAA